jgi:hypothetical protein
VQLTAVQPHIQTLTSLKTLRLSNNELSVLAPTIFYPLTSLQELALDENQLVELDPDTFSTLSLLSTLTLWGNRLQALDASLFAAQTNLRELDLSGNQLTSLPPALFSPLFNLEFLDISENMLSSLPPSIFAKLSNLEHLYLGRDGVGTDFSNIPCRPTSPSNFLTTLPAAIFVGLGNLVRLSLLCNPISTVPWNVFYPLEQISTKANLCGFLPHFHPIFPYAQPSLSPLPAVPSAISGPTQPRTALQVPPDTKISALIFSSTDLRATPPPFAATA